MARIPAKKMAAAAMAAGALWAGAAQAQPSFLGEKLGAGESLSKPLATFDPRSMPAPARELQGAAKAGSGAEKRSEIAEAKPAADQPAAAPLLSGAAERYSIPGLTRALAEAAGPAAAAKAEAQSKGAASAGKGETGLRLAKEIAQPSQAAVPALAQSKACKGKKCAKTPALMPQALPEPAVPAQAFPVALDRPEVRELDAKPALAGQAQSEAKQASPALSQKAPEGPALAWRSRMEKPFIGDGKENSGCILDEKSQEYQGWRAGELLEVSAEALDASGQGGKLVYQMQGRGYFEETLVREYADAEPGPDGVPKLRSGKSAEGVQILVRRDPGQANQFEARVAWSKNVGSSKKSLADGAVLTQPKTVCAYDKGALTLPPDRQSEILLSLPGDEGKLLVRVYRPAPEPLRQGKGR